MKKAVFFDRDGVINKLAYNHNTGEYESPHCGGDLELYPWVLESLRQVKDSGYLMFIISNQPSHAKGKTSIENIQAVHNRFHKIVSEFGIKFNEYFYCYHHPEAVIKEYKTDCACRKPKPYFLLKAKEKYGLDLKNCWLIGDCDSDIFCGQAEGLKTILICEGKSMNKRGNSQPDFFADNLKNAVDIILKSNKRGKE